MGDKKISFSISAVASSRKKPRAHKVIDNDSVSIMSEESRTNQLSNQETNDSEPERGLIGMAL